MKLTAFFLLIGTLHLSASGNAQRISLTLNNAPLASVFKEIEKQTNFNFIYGKEQLEQSRKVNISVSNMALENVLVLVFRDQPLTYTIVDNYIVIKKKLIAVQKVENVSLPARVPDPVKGTVMNSEGDPIAGATISVKGAKVNSTTNANGQFQIDALPGQTLVISHVSYELQITRVKGRIG